MLIIMDLLTTMIMTLFGEKKFMRKEVCFVFVFVSLVLFYFYFVFLNMSHTQSIQRNTYTQVAVLRPCIFFCFMYFVYECQCECVLLGVFGLFLKTKWDGLILQFSHTKHKANKTNIKHTAQNKKLESQEKKFGRKRPYEEMNEETENENNNDKNSNNNNINNNENVYDFRIMDDGLTMPINKKNKKNNDFSYRIPSQEEIDSIILKKRKEMLLKKYASNTPESRQLALQISDTNNNKPTIQQNNDNVNPKNTDNKKENQKNDNQNESKHKNNSDSDKHSDNDKE